MWESAVGVSLLAAVLLAAPAHGAERAGAAADGESKLVRAVSQLEPVGRDRFPDTFAGSWLGTHEDAGRIFVAFTKDAKQSAKSLRKRLPKSDRASLRVLTFKRSLRELEKLETRMISDRELARQGGLSFPDVPGAAYDIDLDVIENVPVVTVQEETEANALAFERRYGSSVVVEEGHLLEPDGCSRLDCGPSIRGGLRVWRSLNGELVPVCSTGFTVRERVRSHPRLGVLSAAHCNGGPGDARYHFLNGILKPYGAVVDELQMGNVDAEWHTVNAPFSAANACIYVPIPNIGQCGVVRDVSTKLEDVPIGLKLCKSGAKTGESCGYVLSKNASPSSYVPNAQQFVKTDFCSEHGDSGGAVFYRLGRYYKAYGILSGSTDYPCGDSRDRTVFGHLEFIQKQLPVRVITQDQLK